MIVAAATVLHKTADVRFHGVFQYHIYNWVARMLAIDTIFIRRHLECNFCSHRSICEYDVSVEHKNIVFHLSLDDLYLIRVHHMDAQTNICADENDIV